MEGEEPMVWNTALHNWLVGFQNQHMGFGPLLCQNWNQNQNLAQVWTETVGLSRNQYQFQYLPSRESFWQYNEIHQSNPTNSRRVQFIFCFSFIFTLKKVKLKWMEAVFESQGSFYNWTKGFFVPECPHYFYHAVFDCKHIWSYLQYSFLPRRLQNNDFEFEMAKRINRFSMRMNPHRFQNLKWIPPWWSWEDTPKPFNGQPTPDPIQRLAIKGLGLAFPDYQLGAHFEALVKCILVAASKYI